MVKFFIKSRWFCKINNKKRVVVVEIIVKVDRMDKHGKHLENLAQVNKMIKIRWWW
jgi:hypothetical protein